MSRVQRVAPWSPSAQAVYDRSQSRCALCFAYEADFEPKAHGEVAHLDHDERNDEEANLVYLCLAHHADHDSRRCLDCGIDVPELVESRTALGRWIDAWEIGIVAPSTPYPRLHPGQTLVRLEIDADSTRWREADRSRVMNAIQHLIPDGQFSLILEQRGSVLMDISTDEGSARSLTAQVARGQLKDLGVRRASRIRLTESTPGAAQPGSMADLLQPNLPYDATSGDEFDGEADLRRAAEARIQRAILGSHGHNGAPFSLLMVQLGSPLEIHSKDDSVAFPTFALREEIASLIRCTLRNFEGFELGSVTAWDRSFLVTLPDCKSRKAQTLLRRVLDQLQQRAVFQRGEHANVRRFHFRGTTLEGGPGEQRRPVDLLHALHRDLLTSPWSVLPEEAKPQITDIDVEEPIESYLKTIEGITHRMRQRSLTRLPTQSNQLGEMGARIALETLVFAEFCAEERGTMASARDLVQKLMAQVNKMERYLEQP